MFFNIAVTNCAFVTALLESIDLMLMMFCKINPGHVDQHLWPTFNPEWDASTQGKAYCFVLY